LNCRFFVVVSRIAEVVTGSAGGGTMIACCGLDCEKCEALVATRNNDDVLRHKVAKKWADLYGLPVKPEHINCEGCRSTGIKTYYCEQMCAVRKCVLDRELDNCAACDAFPCANLEEIFKFAPQARYTLESMRELGRD
jgi:hypothetical protein